MHLLLLLTDLFDSVGGIQTFSRCLVKALDEISFEKKITINILVLNDHGLSSLKENYVKSNLVDYSFCNGNKFFFIFKSILFSIKSDLIVFGHANFLPLGIIFSIFLKRIKIFLLIYGIEAWGKLNLIHKLGFKYANKIISISDFTKSKFTTSNDLKDKPIEVIHCTLDPNFLTDCPKLLTKQELGLPKGQMILTVSRLEKSEPYKGISFMIGAMNEIVKEFPEVSYIIVGEGSDRKRLESLVKKNGLKNKIIFKGAVDFNLLLSYYNACDVFVLPSVSEGFGIVFLEAMYFNKPCIGAKVGAVPEVIQDGKTGFLVTPNDIKSLTDAIVSLLKDDNLRNEFGKEGKKRLKKEFSFEIFKKKLEDILCKKKMV